MNSSSGNSLERFLTGKGFYIVLFLCAAVIGVSAWMMAAGNETMENDMVAVSGPDSSDQRVETIIIPPRPAELPEEDELEVMAPEISTDGLMDAAAEQETAPVAELEESAPVQAAAPIYLWPVEGEVERGHSTETLGYDVTMRDWRTHEGVDILAPQGTTVLAAHAGVVQSIEQDALYGTVLTVAHGDGTETVYANLADLPAVSVGDWVDAGSVIGSVGTTALCEVGQGTHLHFALTVDGVSRDPLDYLPG